MVQTIVCLKTPVNLLIESQIKVKKKKEKKDECYKFYKITQI